MSNIWIELPEEGGGGGGTPPGGTNGELQFNNAGSFGGAFIDYTNPTGIAQLTAETGLDFKLATSAEPIVNTITRLGISNGGNNASNTITFVLTSTGPGVDLIVASILSLTANPADQPVLSVTYLGNNFTFITSAQQGGSRVDKWYLKGVDVDNSSSILITFTGAVDNSASVVTNYGGVDQTTPIEANASANAHSDTPATLNITTLSVDAYIEDFMLSDFTNPGVTAGAVIPQIEIVNFGIGGESYAGPLATPGLYSPFWSWSSTVVDWAYIAIAIKPATNLTSPGAFIDIGHSISGAGANITFQVGSPDGEFIFVPENGTIGSGILNFNSLTAVRTYTFQDASGTLAFLTDIPPATTPASPDKSVQFNNSGAFGGDSAFTFDVTSHRVGINTSTYDEFLNINGNIEMQAASWKIADVFSSVSGTGSAVIGFSSSANANASLAVGNLAVANDPEAVAIGYSNTTSGSGSLTIGSESSTGDVNAIAVGNKAHANADLSIAIGNISTANTTGSMCIGYNSTATGSQSIVIGNQSTVNGLASITIGNQATSPADEAIAIGQLATASGNGATSLGFNTLASGNGALAIQGANSAGTNSICIGENASSSFDDTIVIGINSTAGGPSGVAVGSNSTVSGSGLAFGPFANATGASTAIGNSAISSGSSSLAIGQASTASGDQSVAIGNSSMATNTKSVALGFSSQTSGDSAISIGNSATAIGNDSIAIGLGATANNNNSITIGNGATSSINNEMQLGSSGTPLTFVFNGVITGYNGDTTVANGVSSVVGDVSLTGQNTSLGPTTIFTPVNPGTYRASVYLVISTAGTAGTLSATISWTDDVQAQSTTTTTVALATSGAFVQQTIYLRSVASAISYSTTLTGVLGSPVYAIFVDLERIS